MPFNSLFARMLFPALIVALNMIGSSPALAQTQVATLEELRRQLSPGDFISIVRTTGDPVRGQLRRLGDTDLDLHADTQRASLEQRRPLDLKVPLSAIQSIERPRDTSRNGALIGAGVGAGFSLAMFIHAAAVDFNEIDEWAAGYLVAGAISTGIGALAGWAIDRAHSKPHIRFDAPYPRTA
ncbi:MAG: hypothetical protein ABMA15_23880, partial [Vicinamibacterales bacterium]